MKQLLLLCVLCISAYSQPLIQTKLDLVNFGYTNIYLKDYKTTDNEVTYTYNNDNVFRVRLEESPLTVPSLRYRQGANIPNFKNKVTLGVILLSIKEDDLKHYVDVSFDIKVGETSYRSYLRHFIMPGILMLQMPPEIRVPLDRNTTAVLKFEDKLFYQSYGAIPLEAECTIEPASRTLRETRRR